jgi:polyphosphate glucokinase
MTALGIDIGGSGIKGALVDLAVGRLLGDRFRVETPQPAAVDGIVAAVAAVADHFGVAGPGGGTGSEGVIEHIGVTFPGVVVAGATRTAANLDPSWLEAPAEGLFAAALGRPVTVLNDADAAGIAEVAFGAGRGQSGVTLMLTFGTGIGSALFVDGVLVPNTELGHLELDGVPAEHRAASRARELEDLAWPEWAARVQRYLSHVEALFWPELIIVGGGVSRKADRWLPLLSLRTRVVAAELQNHAGIIGAALAATRAAAGPVSRASARP